MPRVAEAAPDAAAVLAAEEDFSLDFESAVENETEFQPLPFPGAMTLSTTEWTQRTNKDGVEYPQEQWHIAVKPETFETKGLGLPSWYDLPPYEDVEIDVLDENGEPTGEQQTVRRRQRPKVNTKLGRFLKGLSEHIGPNPETGKSYTINDLDALIKAGDGFGLRATWQKVRMQFGGAGEKVIKSKPTLVIVGPHPEADGVKGASQFDADEIETCAAYFIGKTDREVNNMQALTEAGLPQHIYNAIMAGTARKALLDNGVIAKNSGTKVYERAQ